LIPPSPTYERGEKIKKVPLKKEDLGGSKLLKHALRDVGGETLKLRQKKAKI